MKGRYAATAALAATGVYAQSMSAAPSISYTTVTYDDCPSMSMETMITVTNGVTVTYCPECDHHMTTKPSMPGYTTTYTTTYMSLCPTGMVPVTYTVTESCTDAEPTWTPGPSHIPQGFTVTEKECTVCGDHPTTVTMTEPCGCEAHEGVPGPATPAPTTTSPSGGMVSQIDDGQVQAPVPSSGSDSPDAPCDGTDCGGSGTGSMPSSGTDMPMPGSTGSAGDSGSPAPGSSPAGMMPTTSACVGDACRAMATGGANPGVNYTTPGGSGSSGMPTVPEGMPPNSGAGMVVVSVAAVFVAALAFAL